MRLFYYVHTGHRIGLDRFRRAAAIINALEGVDITLLCSDFRIASEAKSYGIPKAVGIDLVRNIPQIAHHGDKIIFDSDEINPTLLEDMTQFFSTFIRISDNPNEQKHPKEYLISPYLSEEKVTQGIIIDEKYTQELPKTIPMALFFGDDDYEKDLEKHQALFAPYGMELLMGYYHFLGYEKALQNSFSRIHESEEYDAIIRHTDILVSSSPMAILQNLSGGGRPIYLHRPDYTDDFIPLFEQLSIPVVIGYDEEKLIKVITQHSSQTYKKCQISNEIIVSFLQTTLSL